MATGKYGGNPPWKGKKGIAGIAATMGPGDSRSSASYSPFSTNLSPNITNYTTPPPRTAPLGYGGVGPLKGMGNVARNLLLKTGMSPSQANSVLQALSMFIPGASEAKGLGSVVELVSGLLGSESVSESGSSSLTDPNASSEGSEESGESSSGGGLSAEAIQNMETQGQLQRISSGLYNAPGGDTSLMGAKGRNASVRGTMRARRKEQNAYKKAVREAAARYDPAYWVTNYGLSPEQAASAAERYKSKYSPEYFANKMKEKNMGIHSVLKDDWESFADSRGVPYNIDELMAAAGGGG